MAGEFITHFGAEKLFPNSASKFSVLIKPGSFILFDVLQSHVARFLFSAFKISIPTAQFIEECSSRAKLLLLSHGVNTGLIRPVAVLGATLYSKKSIRLRLYYICVESKPIHRKCRENPYNYVLSFIEIDSNAVTPEIIWSDHKTRWLYFIVNFATQQHNRSIIRAAFTMLCKIFFVFRNVILFLQPGEIKRHRKNLEINING